MNRALAALAVLAPILIGAAFAAAIIGAAAVATANAQAPAAPLPTPAEQATNMMYQSEVNAHRDALTAAFTLNQQLEAAKKQIADLTKERDELKAKVSEPAPSAPQSPAAAPAQ
jgi:hypothetical protein